MLLIVSISCFFLLKLVGLLKCFLFGVKYNNYFKLLIINMINHYYKEFGIDHWVCFIVELSYKCITQFIQYRNSKNEKPNINNTWIITFNVRKCSKFISPNCQRYSCRY